MSLATPAEIADVLMRRHGWKDKAHALKVATQFINGSTDDKPTDKTKKVYAWDKQPTLLED